jgi:hypothetical protein
MSNICLFVALVGVQSQCMFKQREVLPYAREMIMYVLRDVSAVLSKKKVPVAALKQHKFILKRHSGGILESHMHGL